MTTFLQWLGLLLARHAVTIDRALAGLERSIVLVEEAVKSHEAEVAGHTELLQEVEQLKALAEADLEKAHRVAAKLRDLIA